MLITVTLTTSLGFTSPIPPPPPMPALRAVLTDCVGTIESTPALDIEPPWLDCPPLDLDHRAMMLQTEDATAIEPFGAEGSTRWTINGGWGVDVKETSNNEYQLGVGMQWFLVDDFAFAPEIRLWGFSQEVDNAFGCSFDLLFQWHVLRGENWTFYGDFGCGMLITNHNVPFDGSQFNFTPQAGIGVTFDIGNNRRWIVGVRWHHISNASLYQNNPGRDSVLMYTGLSLPF